MFPSIIYRKFFISKSFSALWLFHLLCLLGSEMTRFALPIWFYQQGDLFSFTLFLCAGILPRTFSPLFGALIDYLQPKKIFFLSGISLIFISLLLNAIISNVFPAQFWLIYLLIFLLGISSNCIHLSTISTISRIIKDDNLLKGNSLIIGAESFATLFSPLIGGYIMLEFGPSFILWLDIGFFSLALLLINLIKELDCIDLGKTQWCNFFSRFCQSLQEGFTYIYREKQLIFLLFLIAIINLIFSLSFALFTPMILSYSNNSELLGLINTIGGCGQILGAIIAGYVLKPINRIHSILKFIFLLGLLGPCLIGIQNSPLFWGIGYAMTLGLLSIINSINHTFWQSIAPLHLQGVIFGIRRMITSSAGPVGMLLAAPTLHLLTNFSFLFHTESKYQSIFLIAGFLISALGLCAFAFSSEFCNLTRLNYEKH